MGATAGRDSRRSRRGDIVALACCALVSGALLAGPAGPPEARADGDPASDVLLAQNAYYPYQPTVSHSLEATLNGILRSAEHSRLPLKVAVIGSVGDLGADPTFFGHPQAYAQFLDREISFNEHPPLLVVMPAGFGVAAAGSPAALAGIPLDAGHGTDGLVRSAIKGALALLRASGHAVGTPALSTSNSSSGGSPTVLFAVPVGLLAVFGLFALSRNRRRREGGPAGSDGGGG